ncbi:hypothetical protein [Sporolactobacillus vineae]|uniref:hypothetical protein n=1 Tax=Sporolactobacillus vineae TaxID=444463 RepID=UPI00028816D5|nr:hypothetical protein [Sporolactobacillus vineae]
MKKFEWFCAVFLILMGITCMTFSATAFGQESLLSFGKTFFRVCVWFLCPVIPLLLLFFLIRSLRKK